VKEKGRSELINLKTYGKEHDPEIFLDLKSIEVTGKLLAGSIIRKDGTQ